MAISSLTSTVRKWLARIGILPADRADRSEAKAFWENQEREGAFDTRDRGIRRVPIDRIVGSVGRYHDFDSRFRLKQHLPQDRLENIKQAIRAGKPIPPVQLYQIKDDFYVLDGNHRIAAARAFQFDSIDAHIVEFIPTAKTLENIRYRQRADFSERTGLSHPIELTEVGQYALLDRQISRHREFLDRQQGRPVDMPEAAEDWYRTIYRPLAAIIEKGELIESFPNRTIADLYVYISWHQWESGPAREYGIGISQLVPTDMEAFRQKMSQLKESEYPEMQRGITAFVLMKVKASKEYRIIDKLFELPEVREIHSVHGDVDILIKIALTRDILASDSEVIGQFVHEKMRQIPGVYSTQTLIPGLSRIKGSG